MPHSTISKREGAVEARLAEAEARLAEVDAVADPPPVVRREGKSSTRLFPPKLDG